MNSVPISPGLHALFNAAVGDGSATISSSPLPAPYTNGSGTHSSPSLTSISTSSQFLSALHLRSPPSSAVSASSPSSSHLTGMSILKMPPSVNPQSPLPFASASTASSPSPRSSQTDSPEREGDADSSIPSSSPATDAPEAPDSPLSSLASASSTHSSTPSAQLQSAFFSSPTAAPSPSSHSLLAPHTTHSPLTSLLQPHSSTLQVRRNSTGGSGITKLLSSFKRTAKATTTLTASTTSSSLFKKKLTAASTLTASSSAASSDSAGGSSCHQCKSRRNYGDLSYCSSSLNKKNKNAVCRKNLKKFYRESPITANGQVWKCPSCRKICCCAACRRREMRGGAGGTNGANGVNGASGAAGDMSVGEMEGASVGMNTPPSNALSPVHSAIKHEHPQQQQQQQDVEMSPVDRSPSPPQSAFRGLLLSPHTPSLPPLPASALSSREREREAREGKDESLPLRDIHRTLLTVANSPALTALSAAASTLNGSSYSIKKEKSSSGLLDGGSMGGGAGAGRYAGLMTASLSRGLGVSALNGHSLLNGHNNGHTRNTATRRRNTFTDMHHGGGGHDSSTSSPSSTDDSDDDTANGEGESSTVGEKEDDARTNGSSATGPDSALSTFALFYSIGQMGVVQEGVREVMKRPEVSNAQKLKEIENIFYQVAEKVSSEEVPLQL